MGEKNKIFIEKAKKIHGDKYDYSGINYTNTNNKIKIICKIHGIFEQTPKNHLKGCGCAKCSGKFKKTTEDFIQEAKKIHGEKYDYSITEYINAREYVNIKCKIHGIFKQRADAHLGGQGCGKCANSILKSQDDYINEVTEIHNNKYDYSLVEYKNAFTKIKIICPDHGIFEQTPDNHRKHGCPKCGFDNNAKLSFLKNSDDFIGKAEAIHGKKYDYSDVMYENVRKKINIKCKKHGLFKQTPNDHLNGRGCPRCGHIRSKGEKELNEFLESIIKTKIIKCDRKILNGKELDLYLPEFNLAVEYNGIYMHSTKFKDKNVHIDKTIECEKKGIFLIHIFDYEWDYKKELIKSILKSKLNIYDRKIYARKCEIREINDNLIVKKFLNENHLQGYLPSKIKLGLFHENELISMMTFGKVRKNKKNIYSTNDYEMYRYCNALHTQIIGGASKLFSFFLKTHTPQKIVTFADRRYSNGDLYHKLGFEKQYNTKLNYYYYKSHRLYSKETFQKHKLSGLLKNFDIEKTEQENMLDNKYHIVYDCGNIKFEYRNAMLFPS